MPIIDMYVVVVCRRKTCVGLAIKNIQIKTLKHWLGMTWCTSLLSTGWFQERIRPWSHT
mgnify:FL=1